MISPDEAVKENEKYLAAMSDYREKIVHIMNARLLEEKSKIMEIINFHIKKGSQVEESVKEWEVSFTVAMSWTYPYGDGQDVQEVRDILKKKIECWYTEARWKINTGTCETIATSTSLLAAIHICENPQEQSQGPRRAIYRITHNISPMPSAS